MYQQATQHLSVTRKFRKSLLALKASEIRGKNNVNYSRASHENEKNETRNNEVLTKNENWYVSWPQHTGNAIETQLFYLLSIYPLLPYVGS